LKHIDTALRNQRNSEGGNRESVDTTETGWLGCVRFPGISSDL
jgi:hypothetical protein